MSQTNPASARPLAPSDGARRRFHVSVPIEYREGDDPNGPVKTWWQPLGVAFEHPGKDGNPPRISVILNALPAGGADGRARLMLFLDDGRRRDRGTEERGQPAAGPDGDDGSPF